MSSAFSTADSYMSVSSNESFCHVEFNGTQRSSPELYNGSVMDLAPQQHYLYQGMDNSMDYHQLTGISSGWNGFHGANSSGSSSFVTLSPASHASGPRSLVNGQSTAGGQSYGKATPSSCGGLTGKFWFFESDAGSQRTTVLIGRISAQSDTLWMWL